MAKFESWNNLSEWYVNQRSTSYGVKNTEDIITKMLGVLDEKRVLDVGMGSGYFDSVMQSMGADVVAVDVSSKMLELSKNQPYFSKNINLSQQSAYNLAFKEGSFDVILADMLLNNTNDIRKVFKQFRNVLKEDGYAIISLLHEKNTESKVICREKLGKICKIKGVWKNKNTGEKHPYELYHIPKKKLKEEIERTGFVIEEENVPLPPESLKEENPQMYKDRMKTPTFYLLKIKKK